MIQGNNVKILLVCISLAMISMSLSAQIVTIPQNRPVDERLQLNEPHPQSLSRPLGFNLPELEKSATSQIQKSGGPRVFISDIKITGNTAVKDAELYKLVKKYIGSYLTQKDISEIRNNLTSYYVNKGYINSGAYMPDQDLSDSILTVNIVEGRLSEINISTMGDLTKEHIKTKLAISKDNILNINTIKNRLYILQQDPLIEKINASLVPTDQRGFAELVIDITEKNPLVFDLFLNNYRPPSVGEFQGVLSAVHLNLTGAGDSGFLSVSKTEGLSGFDMNYEYPIIPGVFSFGFGAQSINSDVVEMPFSLIDIENSSSSWSLHGRYNLHKSLNDEFSLIFTLDSKTSKTTIGGISFNLNDVNADKTRASIFRFSQEWSSHNINNAYVVRSTFSLGFDANDATILKNAPDGEFFSWLGQFQWLTNIRKKHSASVQLVAQLSDDSLLPFEQYASGGRYSVRGFRENAFIRDTGATLNLDYKIFHKFIIQEYPTAFVIFSDFSVLKNKDRAIESKETMASVGLGVQGYFAKNINYEVMWAHAPKKKAVNKDDTLQDIGVHFQISIHY